MDPAQGQQFTSLCASFFFDRDPSAREALNLLFNSAANLRASGAGTADGLAEVGNFEADHPGALTLHRCAPFLCSRSADNGRLSLFLSAALFGETERIKGAIRRALHAAEALSKRKAVDEAVEQCLDFRTRFRAGAAAVNGDDSCLLPFLHASSVPAGAASLLRSIIETYSGNKTELESGYLSAAKQPPKPASHTRNSDGSGLGGDLSPLLASLAVLLESRLRSCSDAFWVVGDAVVTEAAGGLQKIPRPEQYAAAGASDGETESKAPCPALGFIRDIVAFLILTLGMSVKTISISNGGSSTSGGGEKLRMWRLPAHSSVPLTELTLLLTCPLVRPSHVLGCSGALMSSMPPAVATFGAPSAGQPATASAGGQHLTFFSDDSAFDSAANRLRSLALKHCRSSAGDTTHQTQAPPQGQTQAGNLAPLTFAAVQELARSPAAAALGNEASTAEDLLALIAAAGDSSSSSPSSSSPSSVVMVSSEAAYRPLQAKELATQLKRARWVEAAEEELKGLIMQSSLSGAGGDDSDRDVARGLLALPGTSNSSNGVTTGKAGPVMELAVPTASADAMTATGPGLCAAGIVVTAGVAIAPSPSPSDAAPTAPVRLLPSPQLDASVLSRPSTGEDVNNKTPTGSGSSTGAESPASSISVAVAVAVAGAGDGQSQATAIDTGSTTRPVFAVGFVAPGSRGSGAGAGGAGSGGSCVGGRKAAGWSCAML